MTQSNGANGIKSNAKKMIIESAEVLLPCKDIAQDIAFWTGDDLGFRMDQIVGTRRKTSYKIYWQSADIQSNISIQQMTRKS